MAYRRLGDLLVSSGMIDGEQLNKALELQRGSNKRLGELLIDEKLITEVQLTECLSAQLNVEFIDLTVITVPVELAGFVPRYLAKKYNVVPVKLVRDSLYVAMSDPTDFVAREEIKTASHKKIVPMIATRKATEQTIAALYGNEGTARAIEDMKRAQASVPSEILPVSIATVAGEDESGAASAPTIRFVNSVIQRAVVERASDIHLEPRDGEMVVRMRIDGSMRRMFTVPSELQNTVISRLKIMGNMNISERMTPQDGHVTLNVNGEIFDIRISTIPTVFGEKAVMRLLEKSSSLLTADTIGLRGENLAKYAKLIRSNSGVILLVGPTGSGKSTTLCTIIRELSTEEVNIVTLEDPVEYNIPGVNQCQINEKTGMTFASGLRSILRQDPDIISVGEIRDGETASIAIRAAITGHLVLSTMHTNDAVSAVTRLEDIGVEKYLVSAALRGVISQRLVKKICPSCRTAYKPDAGELELLGMPADADVVFHRGVGCPDCYHTGYHGRSAAFEILVVDSTVRRHIAAGDDADIIKQEAKRNGFKTLRDSCRDLVLAGITTVDEAFKVINSAED